MNRKEPTRQTTGGVGQGHPAPNKPVRRYLWLWIALFVFLLVVVIIFSGLAGYQSGAYTRKAVATQVLALSLDEQYQLALDDMQAKRYQVALQRFEYILSKNPTYPNVTEQMTLAMQILYATATPTAPKATNTATPTRDLRPVEDLFNHSLALTVEQAWTEAIETLIALRKEQPEYMTSRVDGLLFLSLRYRGVEKIWQSGDLGGGLYDLSLAERFGVLDVQAASAREFARLYMIGLSFWEIHPEQAVYYFNQVASAAPGLRDSSGWTAQERYRQALIQYGDLLVTQRAWCEAQVQYQLALSIRSDEQLAEVLRAVILKCSPPTNTPQPKTPEATPTSSESAPTTPPEVSATPTPTSVVEPSAAPITPTYTEIPATATEPAPPTETATVTASEMPPAPLDPTNTEETPASDPDTP